jgi:hypothetical protein
MNYNLGEDGHEVEDIYSIPSTDKWEDRWKKISTQHDNGMVFEGLH